MFFGKHISFFVGHLPILLQVILGPYKDFADILRGVIVDLLDPIGDVVIGSVVSHRVGQDYASRPFVISLGDIPESLLPSGIPNLHLDSLVVHLKHLYFEVHPDRCHIVLLEYSLAEVSQQVCLAHPAVPHYDHLQQHIRSQVLLR